MDNWFLDEQLIPQTLVSEFPVTSKAIFVFGKCSETYGVTIPTRLHENYIQVFQLIRTTLQNVKKERKQKVKVTTGFEPAIF